MQNDARREALMRAASELYSKKGISSTSIGDITKRVGVTRSLFYHYFVDKDDITDAVIESHVNDFMNFVHEWTVSISGRGERDIYELLVELAGIMRGYLVSPSSFGACIVRERDANLYQRFVVQSSALLAGRFVEATGKRGSLINITNTRHPRESFYMLAVGVMSTILRQGDVTDEVIADVIVDTLHIETGQTAMV